MRARTVRNVQDDRRKLAQKFAKPKLMPGGSLAASSESILARGRTMSLAGLAASQGGRPLSSDSLTPVDRSGTRAAMPQHEALLPGRRATCGREWIRVHLTAVASPQPGDNEIQDGLSDPDRGNPRTDSVPDTAIQGRCCMNTPCTWLRGGHALRHAGSEFWVRPTQHSLTGLLLYGPNPSLGTHGGP
jgi:hypothetical protein